MLNEDTRFQIDSSGEGYVEQFLILASELCENPKWRSLIQELEPSEPSSPDQLGADGPGSCKSPRL